MGPRKAITDAVTYPKFMTITIRYPLKFELELEARNSGTWPKLALGFSQQSFSCGEVP